MERLGKIFVSWLRDSRANIIDGESRRKSAKVDELRFMVGNINDNAAAKAVIAVDDRIKQSFANGFLRIIRFIRPHHTFDYGTCFITKRQIVHGVFKLLENRAPELFAVPKFSAGFVAEHGYFYRMRALVGEK